MRQTTTAGDLHPRKNRGKRLWMLLFQTKLRFASTVVALALILTGLTYLSNLKTDIPNFMEHPHQHQLNKE